MLNVAVQVAAAFLLAETYAPRLLLLKARALRARTGDANLRTEWETADGALPALLRVALSRPWVMLATQPIVQVLAVYQAFNFGMLYLLISSFPALWEGRYGMPRTDASLNYLSLALGALAGIAVCGPATDAVHARLKRAYKLESDEVGVPEFRLPLMVPPSILTPLAIFLYAWSAEAKTHFLVPNVRSSPPARRLFLWRSLTRLGLTDWRRPLLGKQHHLISVHLGLHCRLLRRLHGFGVGGLLLPPLNGSIFISADRPRSFRWAWVWDRREHLGNCGCCSRGAGAISPLDIWLET